MQRMKKKLRRLGILQEKIDKCVSVDELTKLKEEFDGNSNGSNSKGK